MKKAILAILGIAAAVVWVVFCLMAVGAFVVYRDAGFGASPMRDSTNDLSDYDYLVCCQPILVRGGQLSGEISDAAATQFPMGFCRVIADIRSTGSLSKLRDDHAACPAPSNGNLQAMRSHIDTSYAESLLALEIYGQYCDEADSLDSRLIEEAITHMEQADWHMDQANRIIHSFYPSD
jgi:hypothetical protein